MPSRAAPNPRRPASDDAAASSGSKEHGQPSAGRGAPAARAHGGGGRRRPTPRSRTPRAGTVALVGRPNVGKSTLLNALVGARLAITSHHPQTTRDRVAGILTTDETQFVFLDTPGLHDPRNRLGQRMNDVARGTAEDADLVVFVTDVGRGASAEVPVADREALAKITAEGRPVVLVVNKIDRVVDKERLFELLAAYAALHDFEAIVPLSAKKRDGTARLLDVMRPLLPAGEPLYPEDELSDRPVRFFVAELVREQVLARTRQEVPHGVAVTIDAFEEPPAGKRARPIRITLTIHVAKDSHKGIVIGQGGKMLGAIGTAARERAERLLERKVHLDVRVKATPGWFDDAARLADIGYGDEDRPTRPTRPKRPTRKTTTTKRNGRGIE